MVSEEFLKEFLNYFNEKSNQIIEDEIKKQKDYIEINLKDYSSLPKKKEQFLTKEIEYYKNRNNNYLTIQEQIDIKKMSKYEFLQKFKGYLKNEIHQFIIGNEIDFLTEEPHETYNPNYANVFINLYVNRDLFFYCVNLYKEINYKQSSTKENEITTRQGVILINLIQNLRGWAEFDSTKKARVISWLIGKSYDNVYKEFLLENKKSTDLSEGYLKDLGIVNDFLKKHKLQ